MFISWYIGYFSPWKIRCCTIYHPFHIVIEHRPCVYIVYVYESRNTLNWERVRGWKHSKTRDPTHEPWTDRVWVCTRTEYAYTPPHTYHYHPYPWTRRRYVRTYYVLQHSLWSCVLYIFAFVCMYVCRRLAVVTRRLPPHFAIIKIDG